ncbi:MAG: hypothetical protein DRI57_02300 [Deltaproteobacteria bacterium]|nr:MAG: hypothetical protein DRI57_02300 [Deltaproteobacteria bacterium]
MKQKTISILVIIALIFGSVIAADASSSPEFRGMFELYEDNRSKGIPNYITEDFILLTYSMILNKTVTALEESVLYPEFKGLIHNLTGKLKDENSQDEIAKANSDYLNVLACLLSGKGGDSEAVSAELALIRKAEGIALSRLMKQKIDYTQFRVRGKYTQNEKLGRYFRAMKYAGTVLFPVKESKATGITKDQADFLTRQALSLVCLIYEHESLKDRYNKLESSLSWLFGPPDDLTIDNCHEKGCKISESRLLKFFGSSDEQIAHKDYYKSGKRKDITKIREDLLELAQDEDCQPEIISGLVDRKSLEKGLTIRDVMTGWRFIPQRFTHDSAAFQQLVYDRVTKYKGEKMPFSLTRINGQQIKGFPLGLELMALLGSDKAKELLKSSDEGNYKGYDKAFKKAEAIFKEDLKAIESKDIEAMSETQNPSCHFYIIKKWLNGDSEKNRHLNTCLGFWTYNRYLSILYAKQSYTVVGKSFKLAPERDIAYLEPAAGLYGNLYSHIGGILSNKHTEGLDQEAKERLKNFHGILEKCHSISSEKLEDHAFLNDLDKTLFQLVGTKDLPVITDVHTEPASAVVLEEGLGYPQVVTGKVFGKETRGALFNYYEFKHPMNDRLTDEKWREMLKDDEGMKKLRLSPGSSAAKK